MRLCGRRARRSQRNARPHANHNARGIRYKYHHLGPILVWRSWTGLCGSSLKKYRLLSSEVLIAEIRRVSGYPKFARTLIEHGKTADTLLDDFRELVEVVEPVEIAAEVVRDYTDTPVLGCAVGGQADYIVIGDSDLLSVNSYQGISIVTPAQFLLILAEQTGE